jgi:DNA adenine methylase
MQYMGGKAGVGKNIAQVCSKVLTPGSIFVDLFCGSLNVIRHAPTHVSLAAGGLVAGQRIAIDACGPLIAMWKAALDGWVPPKVVTKKTYDKIRSTQDPRDPMTAFVLFGCSFGGKWCGGYANDNPNQRYAECASNAIVKKAHDCKGLQLEHATFQSKHAGCWPSGTVMYCDPPYEKTTGYKALEPFNSDAFWFWAEQHARSGVHVFVSEGISQQPRKGWRIILEQTNPQGGRLKPSSVKSPHVDRLFYRGPRP